jgi:hypothetical protein
MAEMEQEQIRSLETRVEAARRSREQLQLSDALLTLKSICAQSSKPWLEGVMDVARELAAEIAAQQEMLD